MTLDSSEEQDCAPLPTRHACPEGRFPAPQLPDAANQPRSVARSLERWKRTAESTEHAENAPSGLLGGISALSVRSAVPLRADVRPGARRGFTSSAPKSDRLPRPRLRSTRRARAHSERATTRSPRASWHGEDCRFGEARQHRGRSEPCRTPPTTEATRAPRQATGHQVSQRPPLGEWTQRTTGKKTTENPKSVAALPNDSGNS